MRQLPAFSVSFLVASFFYKFGSFVLECLAFLATWAVIDLLIGLVTRRTNRPAVNSQFVCGGVTYASARGRGRRREPRRDNPP